MVRRRNWERDSPRSLALLSISSTRDLGMRNDMVSNSSSNTLGRPGLRQETPLHSTSVDSITVTIN